VTRVVAGVFVRPMPGEAVAGDACLVEAWARGVIVAVADGLGHGPAAAKAAVAFLDCVRAGREEPLGTVFASAHEALRRTRGAVAVIARFDEAGEKVEIAGVGNVTAIAINGAGDPRLVVTPVGFVGGTYRAAHRRGNASSSRSSSRDRSHAPRHRDPRAVSRGGLHSVEGVREGVVARGRCVAPHTRRVELRAQDLAVGRHSAEPGHCRSRPTSFTSVRNSPLTSREDRQQRPRFTRSLLYGWPRRP